MAQYIVNGPEQMSQILRGHRKTLGLTQREAGANVGLLPKTISALEHDARRSSVETLFRLLSALELELVVRAKPSTEADTAPVDW